MHTTPCNSTPRQFPITIVYHSKPYQLCTIPNRTKPHNLIILYLAIPWFVRPITSHKLRLSRHGSWRSRLAGSKYKYRHWCVHNVHTMYTNTNTNTGRHSNTDIDVHVHTTIIKYNVQNHTQIQTYKQIQTVRQTHKYRHRYKYKYRQTDYKIQYTFRPMQCDRCQFKPASSTKLALLKFTFSLWHMNCLSDNFLWAGQLWSYLFQKNVCPHSLHACPLPKHQLAIDKPSRPCFDFSVQ